MADAVLGCFTEDEAEKNNSSHFSNFNSFYLKSLVTQLLIFSHCIRNFRLKFNVGSPWYFLSTEILRGGEIRGERRREKAGE